MSISTIKLEDEKIKIIDKIKIKLNSIMTNVYIKISYKYSDWPLILVWEEEWLNKENP